jgi:hypothetical protein
LIDLLSLFPSSKATPPVSLGTSVPPTQDFSVQFDDLLQSLFAGIGEETTSAQTQGDAPELNPALSSSPENVEQVLLPEGEGSPEKPAGFLANPPNASPDLPSAEVSDESGQSVDQAHDEITRPCVDRQVRNSVKVHQAEDSQDKPALEDLIVKAWRPPLMSLPVSILQIRTDNPPPTEVSPEPVAGSLPKSIPSLEAAISVPAQPNPAASLQANFQATAKATPEVDIAPPAAPVTMPHPLEVATVGLAAEVQQAVLSDVKKFEIDTRREPAPTLEAGTPEPANPVITTDPIANLRQLQLPPRVIAIQKVTLDPKFADRPKTQQETTEQSDAGTSVQIPQAMESRHAVATTDQSVPAQPIEIPDIPKLQLVRTVSMEVGEAESQVSIRIEERGGDMKLHLGVGNETLHRELESSMGLLIHTLKQEDIQVSTAEVSRKSPIEKVRRMKEANNGHR